MAVLSNDIALLTRGLLSPTGTGLVSRGLMVPLTPFPAVPRDTRQVLGAPDQVLGGMGSVLVDTRLRDILGDPVLPTGTLPYAVNMGGGLSLYFDPKDPQSAGYISPILTPAGSALGQIMDSGTYTGSDVRVLIELADQPDIGIPRVSKQLVELTTLTVSVHRVKAPIRAAGFINTKGFARGTRTIAGTLVMTKFTTEVLYRFLQSGFITNDRSKDTYYTKVDQLPSFNMTILFADEWGHASYQRLLRVEFVTDGSVYSIQDMLTEQTVSYLAADFTPMQPLTADAFWQAGLTGKDPIIDHEKTPGDCWQPKSSLLFPTSFPALA